MTNRIFLNALCAALGLVALPAPSSTTPQPPAAVAAKVALRGEANGIAVREMRLVRKNDILSVQADLSSSVRSDRTLFYRFGGWTTWATRWAMASRGSNSPCWAWASKPSRAWPHRRGRGPAPGNERRAALKI